MKFWIMAAAFTAASFAMDAPAADYFQLAPGEILVAVDGVPVTYTAPIQSRRVVQKTITRQSRFVPITRNVIRRNNFWWPAQSVQVCVGGQCRR